MSELKISSGIMHAPAFGSVRTQIGGAEEASRELARQFYYLGCLRCFATVSYYGIVHRFNPTDFIPKNSLVFASIHFLQRGDGLLENDHTLLKLMLAVDAAARGSNVMFTHYPIASRAYQLTMNVDSPPEAYMGHTWALSTEVNNPNRKPASSLRLEIEHHNAQQIAKGKMLLVIQTRAEAEQLLDLYGISDPKQRKTFIENAIITPLGVQSEFLDIGIMQLQNPAERARLRELARVRFIDHLRKTGMGAEAARLALTSSNNKWMYVIGRLEAGKGHQEALEGFINALGKEPNLDSSLLLVGGDFVMNPIYDTLCNRIAGLPEKVQAKIFMLGNQADTLVIPASDIGIVASRRESFSFVGAKTMAAGNGLLINRDPILMEAMGMNEPIEPHPLTFNPDNPNELGDVMLIMATDNQFRLHQGQRNAMCAQRFQWSTIAANFVAQLEEKLPKIHS